MLFVRIEDGHSIQGPTIEGLEEGENYFQGLEADERGPQEFIWP